MAATAALNIAQVLPDPIDKTLKQIIGYGTIVLATNYGAGGGHGDILDLGGLGLPSDQIPTRVEIYEEPTAGNAPTGYAFLYARGTDQHTGKLVVMQCAGSGNPLAEITQGGAYPGALTAATANLKFVAYFPYGL